MEIKLKKLILIPIVLFVFSASILVYNFVKTGDFVLLDIDLKGGTLVTIESRDQVDARGLEKVLEEKYGSAFLSSLRTSVGYGISIEVPVEANVSEVVNDAKLYGVDVVAFSAETIGPSLGNLFLQQITYILVVAFVLMSVVIFIIYRNLVSSFGIIFAILSNIVTTLAITSLLGIKISLAGFAGLLMLIAYTVDTNIVLTSKVMKHATTLEDFRSKYRKAFKTGVTLIATITITMFIVILLSSSKLLVNIAEILVVGFLSDLLYTWIFNAAVLEMWLGRRQKLV